MYEIDRSTYSKLKLPIGTGYDRRVKDQLPTKGIVHTTNGHRGTAFRNEAKFLRDSPAVGCWLLIGKTPSDGIAEICPAEYRPWHAGVTIPGWTNNTTLGIEVHHAIGELWTSFQFDALTWVLRDYTWPRYGITPLDWDTHRFVALPKGRKVDPSDWSDKEFYAWRQSLMSIMPASQTYVIGVAQTCTDDAIKRSLLRNKAPLGTVEIDRFIQFCKWLEVDAAFVLAVWAQEGGLPYGSANEQPITHNPLNLGDDENEPPYEYATFQLGLLEAVLYLKNVYGSNNIMTAEEIIRTDDLEPRFVLTTELAAPDDTEAYLGRVLEIMRYIKTH